MPRHRCGCQGTCLNDALSAQLPGPCIAAEHGAVRARVAFVARWWLTQHTQPRFTVLSKQQHFRGRSARTNAAAVAMRWFTCALCGPGRTYEARTPGGGGGGGMARYKLDAATRDAFGIARPALHADGDDAPLPWRICATHHQLARGWASRVGECLLLSPPRRQGDGCAPYPPCSILPPRSLTQQHSFQTHGQRVSSVAAARP
jgi:hypothetical protein